MSESFIVLKSDVDREPFVAAAQRAFVRDLDAEPTVLEGEIGRILRHGHCSHTTYDERHAVEMGTRGELR